MSLESRPAGAGLQIWLVISARLYCKYCKFGAAELHYRIVSSSNQDGIPLPSL